MTATDPVTDAIQSQADQLIAHIRELVGAADEDAPAPDRARALVHLLEAGERVDALLAKLQPWRGSPPDEQT